MNNPQPSVDVRITHNPESGWTVRCADRYEDHLDAGEALWCVANILLGRHPAPFLKTQEQHDAWQAKYNPKPLEPWQKQLTGGEK